MKTGRNIYRQLVLVIGLMTTFALNSFSQIVNSDFNHDVYFSKYKTYDFSPGVNLNQNTSNNEFDQKINSAVAAQLNAKGLTQSSNDPDLIITYTAGIQQRAEVENISPAYAGPGYIEIGAPNNWWNSSWNLWWNNWWVNQNNGQTLLIDVRDACSDELVYRVYAAEEIKKPRKQQKEINKIAEKGFKDFPR